MLELLLGPWHWAVAGIFIGLTVPVLLLIGNKTFGISSTLRHACAACLPAGIAFFKYDWKKEIWNIVFVLGVLIGGFLAAFFLQNPEQVQVAAELKTELATYGINDTTGLMPSELFSLEGLMSVRGLVFFVLGGFLVGFGTRYAGGCTSGHAIMGISNLQLPSLIATCCFMAGGFLAANFLVPYLLKL